MNYRTNSVKESIKYANCRKTTTEKREKTQITNIKNEMENETDPAGIIKDKRIP